MTLIPALKKFLDLYLGYEVTLYELGNKLLCLFPTYYDESLGDDLGLVSHFLAMVYEVQDEVTKEADLRRHVQKFLESPEKYLSGIKPRRQRRYRTSRSYRPSLAQSRSFRRFGRPTRSSGARRASRRYTDSAG